MGRRKQNITSGKRGTGAASELTNALHDSANACILRPNLFENCRGDGFTDGEDFIHV